MMNMSGNPPSLKRMPGNAAVSPAFPMASCCPPPLSLGSLQSCSMTDSKVLTVTGSIPGVLANACFKTVSPGTPHPFTMALSTITEPIPVPVSFTMR
ncbi:MAG TPA: hypothetical protein DCZ91_14760 [Lachnospiraceae bacterium]|nr:hypothetical protein [Lachnospiraceae bacterium]